MSIGEPQMIVLANRIGYVWPLDALSELEFLTRTSRNESSNKISRKHLGLQNYLHLHILNILYVDFPYNIKSKLY